MSHEREPSGPVTVIAQRVKELRGRRGWTAAQLGEALRKHGIRWDRFAVSSLESGKRQNVTVQELFALALALDVAPVNLLVPTGSAMYQVTPTRTEHSSDARAWISGRKPLPGTDERTYLGEAPHVEGEPAVRTAKILYNEVEAVALRAGSFRVPDDFPSRMGLVRASLDLLRTEINRVELKREQDMRRSRTLRRAG